jgi:hypothetical protein
VPVDEPLFQPFPPEVVFAGYAAFGVYEATLLLRNNDTVWPMRGRRRSQRHVVAHALPPGMRGARMRMAWVPRRTTAPPHARPCGAAVAASPHGEPGGARVQDAPPRPAPCRPSQVARRVRVEAPDSALFSVAQQPVALRGRAPDGGGDAHGKVAPGMEVAFTVTFRPDGPGDATAALVVATERERFLVPLVGAGVAAALDVPDVIKLREAPPVRAAARQVLLVRNIGGAPGGFALRASPPFSVAPAAARLAPGESLQVVVSFVPPTPGPWEGELEVAYDGGGRATYTRLLGQGRELDVGLSAGALDFLPTHHGRLSQKSVWVVNDSNAPVAFVFKQQPADASGGGGGGGGDGAPGPCYDGGPAGWGQEPACGGGDDDDCGSNGRGRGADDVPAARDRGGGGGGGSSARRSGEGAVGRGRRGSSGHEAQLDRQPSDGAPSIASSGDGASVLADASLAAARRAKQARQDAAADPGLFSSPHFSAFPPRGVVAPRGRMEVVVQFSPDHAREFAATAYVELDGRAERAPLALRGRGLGAVAAFPYDCLDVGEAFVNTPHAYEVELLNRGKVDADFSMQPCHTRRAGRGWATCGAVMGSSWGVLPWGGARGAAASPG